MHIDGAGFQQIIGVPDILHDAFTGQDFLRVLQKQMQQRIFFKGQLYRRTADADRAGHVVQYDFAKMQRRRSGRGGGRPRAAQHSLDAGDELHDAEGLAQVVVRAVVQPLDDVDLAGLGRDHNDRDGRRGGVGAELGQNLVAVLVRQHDVQNDQLGPGIAQCSPKAGRVLAAPGFVAVGIQSILFQLTDAGVVLDDVDHSKYPLL